MLRLLLLAGAVFMVIVAAICLIFGPVAPAIWLFGIGGVIAIGTLFERTFYKPVRTESPGPGWTRTKERFVDPATGKTVEVFYNATTGERQYVSPESNRR
ncbi:MAG: hypothetical protein U1E60_03220 [Reyranellaceae bacterium]